jgi:small subunit ribosomal protein S15
MAKEKEKDKSMKIDTKDSGSSEAQISLLSEKINNLTKHFEEHKNDKHSTIGLLKAVNQRKRLLEYLKRENPESYTKILTKLDLRK